VTDLHTYFETGIGGAITLALIAFSTVFLVLGGLTAIIYAIKYFGGVKASPTAPKGNGGTPPAPAAKPASAPVAAPVSVPSASGDQKRLIAVITAALVEATGRPCRITSIEATGTTSSKRRGPRVSLWRSSAIMEGLESLNNQTWSGR
jgi:Na+-transporting methylmalonyl-CoA/oxaloacetate decarboxylase gamma subunit